ncbi:hypothetical protein [Ruminococcus sp.]|uniref:hypothetical protein n=1 Tax=Ruminococcus sp. TaxID=41978 RepID=UPI003992324F
MKYYGNQIWNAATPSIRKATLLMDEAAFRILQAARTISIKLLCSREKRQSENGH